MDDGTRGLLTFVAAQSVFVAALIHLVLGVTNWLRWIQGGFLLPRDFRWPVFVVSALLLFVGMYVATPVFVVVYGVVYDLGWKMTLLLTAVASVAAHLFLTVFNAPVASGLLL